MAIEPMTSETDLDLQIRVAHAMLRLEISSDHLRSVVASKLGISPLELRALMFVAETEAPQPKVLSSHLGLTTGSTTAMLDRLETAGMVMRRPHPTDRRRLILGVTKAGERAMNWLNSLYLEVIEKVFTDHPEFRIARAAAFLQESAAGMDTEAQNVVKEDKA